MKPLQKFMYFLQKNSIEFVHIAEFKINCELFVDNIILKVYNEVYFYFFTCVQVYYI